LAFNLLPSHRWFYFTV